jgi:ribosome-binding ATPase YchF (GTP1/OBG family)
MVLDYIKNTIEILVESKVEERLESLKKNPTEENEEKSNEYESLLRKLESDIRQHIRVRYKNF